MKYNLYNDDCIKVLKTFDENSIDTCITDPPYHLASIVKRFGKAGSAPAKFGKDGAFQRSSRGFLGQEWDGGDISFDPNTWKEVYRVLKPGGMLLSFGGTRTYHRMVCAVEDAGFSIRDCIVWVHGQGLPKSQNIGKNTGRAEWDGWGTNLKPSCELIAVAQKPIDKTYAHNALTWGVAGYWIDGGRIKTDEAIPINVLETWSGFGQKKRPKYEKKLNTKGRWTSNFIHDGSDEVLDLFPNGEKGSASRFFYCAKPSRSERDAGLDCYLTVKYNNDKSNNGGLSWEDVSTVVVQLLKKVTSESTATWNIDESGESITGQCQPDSLSTILTAISKTIESKILHSLTLSLTSDYTAGANCEMANGGSPAESVESLRKWILTTTNGQLELARGASNVALQMLLKAKSADAWSQATNFHATVKPVELMRYLVRLTKTPSGGVVLDPFMGSGTSGVATILENREGYIGIESSKDYFEIAEKRIQNAFVRI